MGSAEPVRQGRINMRVNERQERVLRAAADQSGKTLTGFVLSVATERAEQVLERPTDQHQQRRVQTLLEALDAPAEDMPTLRRYAQAQSPIPIVDQEILRTVEALTAAHHLDEFDCGVDSLNRWLRQSALIAAASGTAATYVLCRGERVVGYYALAMSAVEHGKPHQDCGAAGRPVPVVLLPVLRSTVPSTDTHSADTYS